MKQATPSRPCLLVRGLLRLRSSCVFAVLLAAGLTPSLDAQIANGVYYLRARHSIKALDLPSGSQTNGTQLTQWDLQPNANQAWLFTRDADGTYKISLEINPNKVIEAAGAFNGAAARIWDSNNSAAQRWRLTAVGGYYKLTNKLNESLALDVKNFAQGNSALVQVWTYGDTDNQKWNIITASPSSFETTPNAVRHNLGMNLSSVADWDGDILFTDAMRQARQWSTPGTTDEAAPRDALGWPTANASVVVWHGRSQMQGTYKLSFNGQANVGMGWGGGSLSAIVYDAASNTSSATLTYTATNGNGCRLEFSNTRRTSGSALNTGVTNVRLMRPTAVGAGTAYDPATTFTTPIKDLVKKVQVVRMMDATGSNGGTSLNGVWSNRRPRNYFSQAANGSARGMAWEYAIQFWNETDKDAYVNIPFPADDNYVTQLATLLKNSLESDRKIYVEYSNELWNTWGSFPGGANRDAAIAAVQANTAEGRALNYDNIYPGQDSGGWSLAKRRIGYHAVRVSNIFRSVFGDAAMDTRVRVLCEGQMGNPDWLVNALLFIENYYNNGAGNFQATPRPVNYYLFGCGGSAYYSPNNDSDTLSADSILTNLGATCYFMMPAIDTDFHLAACYGLKRVAYEGGPGLDVTGHSEAAKAAAWGDSRMQSVILAKHRQWQEAGGDLLCYFFSSAAPGSSGYYQWAFTSDISNQDTPKLRGLSSIPAQVVPALKLGRKVPGTFTAGSWGTYAGGWRVGREATQSLTPGQWLSYTVRQAGDAGRNLRVNAGGTGSLKVYLNDELKGTITTRSGDSDLLNIGWMVNGQHGIRLKNTGSTTIYLNSITVQ